MLLPQCTEEQPHVRPGFNFLRKQSQAYSMALLLEVPDSPINQVRAKYILKVKFPRNALTKKFPTWHGTLPWSEYICFFQGLGMFLSCLSVLGAEGEAARTCRSSILEYRYVWSYMKAGTGTGTYVSWYAKATKPFDIIRLLHCFLSKKTQQAYMDLVKTLVVNTVIGWFPAIHALLHLFFSNQVWVTADHWHPRPSTIPSDGPPHSTPMGTWLIINTATVVDCIFSLFDMSFFCNFQAKECLLFPPLCCRWVGG